jgi:hypothetical protein
MVAHDVFVSYSSKDKTIADTIVAALENNHIRCWYAPRDIKSSEDWGKAITGAIEQCKVFLLIFSGNANHSQRVLDELNFSISQQVVILPFRVENLEPQGAMKLHLSSRHWLDAYEPSWHSHIKKLVKDVSVNLETSIDEKQIVLPASIEKKIAQQQKKMNRIMAGVVIGALVVIAGWFGWTSMNKQDGGAAAASQIETTTPQVSLVSQEPESTETPALATQEPTIEPTLYDSSSDLGIPDYETDFFSFGMEDGAWPVGKQDADGEVSLGSDGTMIVQNFNSLLYQGTKKYINSIIEVDAKFLSIEENRTGAITLLCRLSNREFGYRAIFTSTGKVSIVLNNMGATKIISSGKASRFEMDKFYRLRYDCEGTDFKAYVNGSLIAAGSDNGFYSGALGITTGGENGPAKVIAAFDNFKLWLP